MKAALAFCLAAFACVSVSAADPFADTVVDHTIAGAAPAVGFDNPSDTLGEPTRVTDPTGMFGGPTTPFNASFGVGELLSLNEGDSLTVRFDEPVVDDPNNPFGIDLLVFGNSFLVINFADGVATNMADTEGGLIEVSSDGITFTPVTGVEADGLFPTVGFSDVTDPFPSAAGVLESDFTLPVDPTLTAADFDGLTTAEIIALYGGSGGGAGIDIGLLGLSEISYVRVSNPVGSGSTPEIDAFADVSAVPEPTSAILAVLALVAAGSRRP